MNRVAIDVFVTDGFHRKSLAAVRALGRTGFRVGVGELTHIAPALHSRYAARRVVYPSPFRRPAAFVRFIRKLDARVILPMEEEVLLLLLRAGEGRIPFGPLENIEWARDKRRVTELAHTLGLSVPESYEEAKPRFPCVVKPRIGSGSRGRTYCESRNELRRACESLRSRGMEPLVQERVAGEAVCVSLLYDSEGHLRAYFAHRRLREWPASGGPSTVRESLLDETLLTRARILLEALSWRGIAQVEFKGGHVLEINPRFWGSLHLAVTAGVNFPAMLVDLFLGRPVDFDGYRPGVRSTWWWPGELIRLLRHGAPTAPAGAAEDTFGGRDGRPVAAALMSFVPLLARPEFRPFLAARC